MGINERVWDSINEKADLHWPSLPWNHLVQWAASNIHHKKNTMSMIARLIMAAS
ncbi:hypothetical protein OIU85_000867, partial [Salix viminalis]